MSLLGIDLGGTKAVFGLFNKEGVILRKNTSLLGKRKGREAGKLITDNVKTLIAERLETDDPVESIGISVPGICHPETGTVWTPNIDGWENYPLRQEILSVSRHLPVTLDSDRACSILGELWQGNAIGCHDAVFLAVGTGIGAGIIAGGKILRGTEDVAGAIGWMGLCSPFKEEYRSSGFFEYYSSGAGLARFASETSKQLKGYKGPMAMKEPDEITSQDVFTAYETGDRVAVITIDQCIIFWGMAAANLVSLFNPEKIIFGGGVFGPARKFIPQIKAEAEKWAQPISMKKAMFEPSALGGDAAAYGAGFLALKRIKKQFGVRGR